MVRLIVLSLFLFSLGVAEPFCVLPENFKNFVQESVSLPNASATVDLTNLICTTRASRRDAHSYFTVAISYTLETTHYEVLDFICNTTFGTWELRFTEEIGLDSPLIHAVELSADCFGCVNPSNANDLGSTLPNNYTHCLGKIHIIYCTCIMNDDI